MDQDPLRGGRRVEHHEAHCPRRLLPPPEHLGLGTPIRKRVGPSRPVLFPLRGVALSNQGIEGRYRSSSPASDSRSELYSQSNWYRSPVSSMPIIGPVRWTFPRELRTLKTLIVLFGLFAMALSAADVTGTWKAVAQGTNGTIKRTFVFKQDGTKLTGKTISDRWGKSAIENGKIE